jgi:hypothetical protein
MKIAIAMIVIVVPALLLWAVVRFSIVSSRRMKGAEDRLRSPDPTGVETVCGFRPSADLVDLYRNAPMMTRSELILVDHSSDSARTWSIGGFFPLTAPDVSEMRAVTGVRDGIPIADDMEKGTYFAAKDGRILFRPPGAGMPDIEVAPSASVLAGFEIREDEKET